MEPSPSLGTGQGREGRRQADKPGHEVGSGEGVLVAAGQRGLGGGQLRGQHGGVTGPPEAVLKHGGHQPGLSYHQN